MRDASVYYLLGVVALALLALVRIRSKKSGSSASVEDGDDPHLAALRSDLLTKMKHNQPAVDRILNGLRRKHPGEPLASIYERAIQDWLRDNNRG